MKKIILIKILLLVFNIAYAQNNTGNIEGFVKDETGKAIGNVKIVLQNTSMVTKTNENGFYRIKDISQGTYTLEAYIINEKEYYEIVTISNNKTSTVNIVIENYTYDLAEIIVDAKTEARELREQAMPISVISMDALSGTVTSITDVLQKTVGVTIRNSGGVGASTRLSVRGLEGKRIGFFIEEIPLGDQSDFIDLNDIPVDMIDRIEIYKGVVPAKFGGSSMGGAINIVLKEYPDKYADLSYMLESFNTHKIQAIAKRNLKDKGILVGIGGGYTYSDNDYEMIPPNLSIKDIKVKRDHDQFKKMLLGVSLKAKKWWFDEVEFEPIYMKTYRQIQGIETNIREAFSESSVYAFSNSLKKNNFLTAGLDFDMTSVTAYTQYSLVDTAKVWYDWRGNSYPTRSLYGGEIGSGFASDSDNKKFNFMNKLNLSYIINQQHTLNFNSFFTLTNGYPKDELRTKSLGRETQFDSKMMSLVLGFNYDYQTKDGAFLNSFTTRYYHYDMKTKYQNIYSVKDPENINLLKNDFGISDAFRYKFNANFLTKFSVGCDVRIPSENELLGDGYSITPSEKLMPERNITVNAGLLYDLTGKSKSNLQLELSGFYMHLEDMIRFTKSYLGAQFQNFGKMQSIGVEFEAKADVFSFLYAYGNVTYQDLKDVREYKENSNVPNPTKGKRMPNIPYLLANAGLEFHQENLLGGRGQNTRIFTDISFIEEYLYDFEVTTEQRRIPRSFVIDLGFEQSFMNRRLFFSGKIRNLTNATVLSEFNRPLPGINFGIKLRYIFSSNNN